MKGAWKFVRAKRQVKHASLDGSAASGVVYGVHTTTPVRRPLRRAAAARERLTAALADWNAREANTATDEIEEALDEAEQDARKLKNVPGLD